MGKTALFARLAAKDLRRHLSEAALLLVVIAAAATTLTLGLVLHGETNNPYNITRTATAGPDAVANLSPNLSPTGTITANADPAQLAALQRAPGVAATSGPYPVTFALLKTRGLATTTMIEGRDPTPGSLDDPVLTAGTWIGSGGAVIERSFADALGVGVGDSFTLNGRRFRVAGIAVDAAIPPYPHVCGIGCDVLYRNSIAQKRISFYQPGLIWMTRSDTLSLAAPDVGVSYLLNLKLSDPSQAPAFSARYTRTPEAGSELMVSPWQHISAQAAKLVSGPRTVLLAGSGLLVVLALASVAVLVGGRLAEQTRRVGLLKAVGATPATVAAVLLAEHLAVTIVAAAAGVLTGWAVAPLLTGPGAGLLGTAGSPPLTVSTVATVIAAALAVAILATMVPAVQAARTSTIAALADAARQARRHRLLIAASTGLPVPLLLGARLAGRRPRRAALSALSVAVSVAGIVAVLIERSRLGGTSGLANPQHQRITQVLWVITIMLIVLTAINAVLITWATVLDGRRASALARALGASPGQVSVALTASQFLSVLPGSILGVPLGIALVQKVGKSSDAYKHASIPMVILVIVGTWLIMSALTAIPARIGTRQSAAQILQTERD